MVMYGDISKKIQSSGQTRHFSWLCLPQPALRVETDGVSSKLLQQTTWTADSALFCTCALSQTRGRTKFVVKFSILWFAIVIVDHYTAPLALDFTDFTAHSPRCHQTRPKGDKLKRRSENKPHQEQHRRDNNLPQLQKSLALQREHVPLMAHLDLQLTSRKA